MKLKIICSNLYDLGRVLNNKILKVRTPLIVAWSLTNRCNLKCRYCNTWNMNSKELTTDQIFSVIDDLKEMGARRIGFTGGEPLLREDIGQIVAYAKSKGLTVGISTNGLLVRDKQEILNHIDSIQLSLDGPEKINDSLRGKGAFKRTIDAVRLCRKHNVLRYVVSVITKKNINEIEYLSDLARKEKFFIFFQPVEDYYFSSDVKGLVPSREEYNQSMKKIMKIKKKNRYILNSWPALRYMKKWPKMKNKKKVKCYAGHLFCRIEPDGSVYSCDRMPINEAPPNCGKIGFKQAFKSLKFGMCDGCLCNAAIEFNLLFSLNPSAIINAMKFVK